MKWEYCVAPLTGSDDQVEVDLDFYGGDGWELVAVDKYNRFYFKRPLEEEASPEEDEGLG